MNDLTRPYRDLLAYQLGETRRWHAWLDGRPAALAARVGEGRLGTVRDNAAHVAIVDLRYAQRLRGMPVVGFDAFSGMSWPGLGTEVEPPEAAAQVARDLAEQQQSVIAVSGPIDHTWL